MPASESSPVYLGSLKQKHPSLNRLDSVLVFIPAAVLPTDVPDVGVQAHVSGGFLELQTGVGSCQLPAAIRVPRQSGDSPLHLVRVSADTQMMKTNSKEDRVRC